MNRRNFLSATGAAFLTIAASAKAQIAQVYFEGPPKTVLPLLKAADNKLYLIVPVNGRDLVFFIDSGATTIIDLAIAKEMGLALTPRGDKGYGLNGGVSDRITSTVTMQLGKLKVTGTPVDCMDFSQVKALSREHSLPEYDGLLGGELLVALRAVIDYEHLTLTLKRPS